MAPRLIYAAFFVSGLTALLYEIVWQRLLVRLTGATMEATVATFVLFMLGLGLGSFFSIRLCEKTTHPIKTYAQFEALIAVLGLSILYLCDQSSLNFFCTALAKSSSFYTARASIVAVFSVFAGVAMTIATASMSVAFNCGLRATIEKNGEPAKTTIDPNLAYSLNLAGAAIGSISGAFLSLPTFGLTFTALIAFALTSTLAIVLFMSRLEASHSLMSSACKTNLKMRDYAAPLLLIFAFSFIAMALEVTWTRLLCLVCGSSTYAVGSVLTAILVSLCIAALIAKNSATVAQTLPFIQLAKISAIATLLVAIDLLLMPYLTWSILRMQHTIAASGGTSSLQFFIPRIAIAFGLICPSTFFIGHVTPVLIKSLNQIESSLRMTAYALTASTVGSIAGALLTAFVIIPDPYFVSGIEAALVLSTLLLAALSIINLIFSRDSFTIRKSGSVISLIGISFAALAIHPPWQTRLMALGPSFVTFTGNSFLSFEQFRKRMESPYEKCLFYKEGASSTVSVETNEKTNVIFLKSNGKIESTLPLDWSRAAPTSDFKTQLFLGIVPVLCFGQSAKKLDALTVGFGSGITSGLLLSFDQIAHLTVCEIEPAIYRASHFFDKSNFDPLRKEWLDSRRIRAECADARAFLNQNDTLFDIIVSQPSEPWSSGASDLFTAEFFGLARTHLKEHGVFVQWLQLYCIDERLLTNLIATFATVFPNTYVIHPEGSGDLVLVGVLDRNFPKDFFQKNISHDLSNSGMSEIVLTTLKKASPESIPVLSADFILTPDDVSSFLKADDNLSVNTDGRIATEYQLPQELLQSDENINRNIIWLKSVRAHQ